MLGRPLRLAMLLVVPLLAAAPAVVGRPAPAGGIDGGGLITVAAYQQDWRPGTPAPGWSYGWNETGAPRDGSFTPLRWNGAWYDSDGIAGEPSDDGFAWGHVGPWGVHPGLSDREGEAEDRYAILRYTVSTGGRYGIVDSRLDDIGCESGGVWVRVLVNTEQVAVATTRADRFDTDLGPLEAGDVIDVAVGPEQFSHCDATDLDFRIVRTTGPAPVGVFDFGTASRSGPSPATGWSFLWNRDGPIGDPAGYRSLLHTPQGYNTTGQASWPTPDEFAFGRVGRLALHPGRDGGGDGDDRFAIVRFTAPVSGRYRIVDSEIRGAVGSCPSGGVELQIRVGDTLVWSRIDPFVERQTFDNDLGELAAGTPIDVALGPAGDDVCDGMNVDYRIRVEPTDPGTVVASFGADYRPVTPAAPWSYRWIQLIDPTEAPLSGQALMWNGVHYDADGIPGPFSNNLFEWGHIAGWGVHPGTVGGGPHRGWALIRYTVGEPGMYSIVDSIIADRGCEGGGVDYRIYAGEEWTLVGSGSHVGTEPGSFDLFLGPLFPGEPIHLAIGPGDDSNRCDATDLDFSIARAG